MTLHPYQRSRHSNAGNCECGMAEESRAHPHAYTQAYRSNLCVCAYPADHPIHTDADTAAPNPAYPEARTTHLRGIEAGREAVRQARGDEAYPQTPILFAAAPAGPAPAADPAALRERTAEALYEAEYPGFDWRQAHSVDWEQSLDRADAVLAVLPVMLPTSDQQAAALTDREKAMLGFALEMAQEEIYARSLEFTDEDQAALERLRRLAGEAPQDEGEAEAPGPWLVQKICCGSDDGTAEFATWEAADRFREEYIDSARIASHERTAIVRAAREAQQDPTQDGEERETDEQRADREETERDHAAGDHRYCGQTCEVEFPTEHLRNFVIAKGYPGTKGALDELLRRAAVARPGQPETEARCPEAVWTPTPHPPHTWDQSPTHPQRPCPGVPAPE